jgi:biotin transport system substrate-specific component
MPSLTKYIVTIPIFTGLTCIGGFIRIPLAPVPITLQTLFVYLAGISLGPWPGMLSQYLFLIIGLIGIPVFAHGSGPAYLFQPTFGYLLAFPLAAWVTGAIARRVQLVSFSVWALFPAMFAGMGVIFAMGYLGLVLNLHWIAGKTVRFIPLLWSGVLLFIPGEIMKMILAGYMAKKMFSLIPKGSG